MNIYLLERVGRVGYDEYDGFVIAATSETEARNLCDSADEGDIWDNQLDVTCTLVGTASEDTEKGIILGSFNAG
jgi:hypothetical protein